MMQALIAVSGWPVETIDQNITHMMRDRRSLLIQFSFVLLAFGTLTFSSNTALGSTSPSTVPAADGDDNFLFLPLILGPPPSQSELEVTQAVQQPDNSVTLIADRTTYVRYTLTSETAYSGVNAYLHGKRGGVDLPDSPIAAFNNPRTLKAAANRATLNDTFNFELPESWVSGTVELWGSATNGGDYSITQTPITVTFNENDPLRVTIVPIAYTCTSGGSGTKWPSSPYTYLDDFTMKVYPVPSVDMITRGTPVYYSGPCSDEQPNPSMPGDWQAILAQVDTAYISDGKPNRYYYGLMDIYCPVSCYSGLGYIGYPVAMGFDLIGAQNYASHTHAHETGHNHGRYHSPGCGAGGADESFPYQIYSGGEWKALIGDSANPNYGFDIDTMSIKVYSSYYDLMSYCDPDWTSDYTYEAFYTYEQSDFPWFPLSYEVGEDSLLVSGTLAQDGSVALDPAFRLDIPAMPSGSGPYVLQLRDEEGALIAEHAFDVLTAEFDRFGGGPGGEVSGFSLAIPYQAGVERMDVVREGEVVGELLPQAEVPLQAFAPPELRLEAGLLHAKWPGMLGSSYLVRLSHDGGETWQTAAVGLRDAALNLPLEGVDLENLRIQVLTSDGIHTSSMEFGLSD